MALSRRHRVDDADRAADHAVRVSVRHILLRGRFLHRGRELIDEARHGSHAAHLNHLLTEVIQIETAGLSHAVSDLLRLFGVDIRCDIAHQSDDVAHAENAARHGFRIKRIEAVELFARTDELDRLTGHLADRKRRAAAGVTVHLREDDAGERQPVVENFCRVDCVLAHHRVDHEERFDRLQEGGQV